MMWWGWMVLGALLLVVELLALDAQFYLVFLGVSAVLVGLVSLMGIALPEWGQWVLFAVLALISFFTFRKSLYQKLRGSTQGFSESLDGEQVTVDEYLAVGAQGRTEFRGTQWSILNVGEKPIEAGQTVRVIQVDGVTLRVKGE